MINWYRNKQRFNRLFLNKKKRKHWLGMGNQNLRIVLIRKCAILAINYEENTEQEINNGRQNLILHGLIPPNNKNECLQMIDDLRSYKV